MDRLTDEVLNGRDELVAQIKLQRFIEKELIRIDLDANGLKVEKFSKQSAGQQPVQHCPPKINHAVKKVSVTDKHSAIANIQIIMNYHDAHGISSSEAENIFHEFITKEMSNPPGGSPKFAIRQYFPPYVSSNNSTTYCEYCKQIDLPSSIYKSHIFKDTYNTLNCPNYPGDPTIFKFDNLIQEVINMLGNLEGLKFCEYCRNVGKSREMYMSHNEKLDNGTIICPIQLATKTYS